MHPRISVSSICFLQNSLTEQAEYWQQLQTRRVGLVGMQMEAQGIENTRQLLKSADVQVETIMYPFLNGQTLEAIRNNLQPPRDTLMQNIDTAAKLKARSIYMVTGGRGNLNWDQAADTFTEAIAPCVKYAKQRDICLMIENAPPAYADIHIAHSLRDSLTLIKQAGIKLCIDLPGCWTEAGLSDLLTQAAPYCGLVQLSDYVCGDRCLPARAVPGDGDIPLTAIIDDLLRAGYEGAFELELIGPRIDDEGHFHATKRACQNLSEILNSLT